MPRFMLVLCALMVLALGACTNSDDLNTRRAELGNFALAHNVVVAPHLVKGPLSREMSDEAWIKQVKADVAARMGRYSGSKLYHLGISLDGYVLAAPGVPLVFSPKSALIINVTVWDDAAGAKLNPEAKQFTVFESAGKTTLLGSGLTQSAEVQMGNLSRNAAKMIEDWLERQNKEEGWFAETPAQKAERLAQEAIDPVIKPAEPAEPAKADKAAKDAAAKKSDGDAQDGAQTKAQAPAEKADASAAAKTKDAAGAETGNEAAAAGAGQDAAASQSLPMAPVIEAEPAAPLTAAERRAARKAARAAKKAAAAELAAE